jgi:cyanate permease
MSSEPQPEPPRKNNYWGRLGFFFLALAPVPLGLLFVKPDLWEGLNTENRSWTAVVLIFSVVGCVGLLYESGEEKKGWEMIGLGVLAGLFLAFVEGCIITFFGCCHGLSHL